MMSMSSSSNVLSNIPPSQNARSDPNVHLTCHGSVHLATFPPYKWPHPKPSAIPIPEVDLANWRALHHSSALAQEESAALMASFSSSPKITAATNNKLFGCRASCQLSCHAMSSPCASNCYPSVSRGSKATPLKRHELEHVL